MAGRRLAILALGTVLVTACTGSASQQPAASVAASGGTPAQSAVQSSAPSANPASNVDQALFQTTFEQTTGATTGGMLVVGGYGSIAGDLNPFYTLTLADVQAMSPVLRGLVTVTSDGKYIPDLADHVPSIAGGDVVISGTTVTVKVALRPNLKWSDGSALTMNDFKATWAWAHDPGQTGCVLCGSGWNEIGSIDVDPDGTTATLHFKELYAGWLSFLTSQFFQAAWLKGVPPIDGPKSMPLTAALAGVPYDGPFRITNASDNEIDYARNSNWSAGVDLAAGGAAHPAYLDGLKLVTFGTKDGEINAFKSGAIDLALNLSLADQASLSTTDPSVGASTLAPLWQYEHLDLNNDSTHARGTGLWLPAVRKAIAMAIDKADLLGALFPGQPVQPICSPTPGSIWYLKAETCPAFDVAGANALLDSAGLTRGSDGSRRLTGKAIDLELCTMSGNPTRLTILQKVQGYLAAVGLKSHIATVDANAVLFAGWPDTKPDTDCSLYRGTYDIADFAYVLSSDPYSNYYYTYASSQFPELGDHSGSNDTRFSDPAMDAALATLESDVDLNQQYADAGALQDAYNQGIPEIPLYFSTAAVGLGVHVGGWPGYNPTSAGPTWETEDWFYKP
jgi:peptide/nickel transport system substrate-binding protein